MELKNKNNYNTAIIQLLKIQVHKLALARPAFTAEKNRDKLIEKLESMYIENQQLKQSLDVKDQDFKVKLGKLQRLNSELVKQLNLKSKNKNDESAISQTPVEGTLLGSHNAALRLKINGLIDRNKELEQRCTFMYQDVKLDSKSYLRSKNCSLKFKNEIRPRMKQ